MITHVVFDFDGTLADSTEVAVRLYNELAQKHGYGKLTASNLEELRRLSILERCSRLGVPPYRLPWLVVQVGRSLRSAIYVAEHPHEIAECVSRWSAAARTGP